MKYDSILLTTFGGPESLDQVMLFLERVTYGVATLFSIHDFAVNRQWVSTSR